MNKERLHKIIVRPIVSEKSSVASSYSQYVFSVIKSATKYEIKASVELLFNVDVKQVNTMNFQGKKKVFARRVGFRPSWKKAVVRLKEGQTIDFSA